MVEANNKIRVFFHLYLGGKKDVGSKMVELNMDTTIREVKGNLMEESTLQGPLTVMFQGLLLEDDATLFGLGVLDGDLMFVSDTGTKRFCEDEMNTGIANPISPGRNNFIVGLEEGLDVIHENRSRVKDSLIIPSCCRTCISCIREIYLFREKVDQSFSKYPHVVKNMPNFSDFLAYFDVTNHEEVNNWEYHENCLFDCYEDQLHLFINSLPRNVNKTDYLKVISELYTTDDNTGRNNRACPRENHTNCTDPVGFYIGPVRNSNLSNYDTYPPAIRMKVDKITDKTTLQDLIYSYELYSKHKVLSSRLSYGNQEFDLMKTVFDVIGSNANMNNHYFSFVFDSSIRGDIRSSDVLVSDIHIEEGNTDIDERKKKKKTKICKICKTIRKPLNKVKMLSNICNESKYRTEVIRIEKGKQAKCSKTIQTENGSTNSIPTRESAQNEFIVSKPQPANLNKELHQFILNQISEKEKELECPVCLVEVEPPIFMCSELHLICSDCKPKITSCPECRIEYTGDHKRHRYAEKNKEELARLRNKLAQMEKSCS